MARIYDNISPETSFKKGLEQLITGSQVNRLDLCVGYFNLRGWDLIANDVDKLTGDEIRENGKKIFRRCRLLIGMHRPPEELIRQLYSTEDNTVDRTEIDRCRQQIAIDFRNQLTLGVPSKEAEQTLQQLSRQMKEDKVCVKLYLKNPMHAKLYISYRPDDNLNPIPAIMGSSNLTYSGLNRGGELNAFFGDEDTARKLSKWFEERWEENMCIDITQDLIQIIDNSWAAGKEIPPYYIYLRTAYLLSAEARAGENEYTLPKVFQNVLLPFQSVAVKLVTKNLANGRKNGAMLGDVVGLGKTITACAVSKLFEQQNGRSTLIICPANLQDMWNEYVKTYDLKADVMSMAKKIDLNTIKYYGLIIIDESHNLRNGEGQRYRDIKSLIDNQPCQVLLLTATPYNKDFTDLSSQLKLFVDEGADLGIRPEAYINSLGGERAFIQHHNDVFIRSLEAFEKSPFPEDWQELMSLFLVRRTRSFIKDSYADTDADGRYYLTFSDGTKHYFPERIPKAIKFETSPEDQFSRLYSENMIELIDSLLLPRYGLSQYIDENKKNVAPSSDVDLLNNLSKAGGRMRGFCKSTFFKRIDSSGYSFLLTLFRHILRNQVFIYAIDNNLDLPIGDETSLPDDFYDDDDMNVSIFKDDINEESGVVQKGQVISIPTDMNAYVNLAERYYNLINSKNSSALSWISPNYFKPKLKKELMKDCMTIVQMVNLCGDWDADNDPKLNQLYKLISSGVHKDEKILIFTQYSDTAEYLNKQLKIRNVQNIDCATGNSANPTEIAAKFSPISNNRLSMPLQEQTRVLVATDVLSEGQNLQDSHVVVNYDMPWAIIRLIQRAGRVDRIGQESKTIDCYSFFPVDGVENIINLRRRLNERINNNADIVGSDEIFFEGNEQNLKDLFNEKKGAIDDDNDDEDDDIDLASYAYQIWKDATDADPKLNDIIPTLSNAIYSTKKNSSDAINEGVIAYSRTYNGYDVLEWLNSKGEMITQSQMKILKAMQCSRNEPAVEALPNHHELVAKTVDTIRKQLKNRTSGILGNNFSTKNRIVKRLETYCKENTLFATQELKDAIDDIYNYPLRDSTKVTLGQLLRKEKSDVEIVEYVEEMQKANLLCVKDEDSEATNKDPKLICSMGLRNQH